MSEKRPENGCNDRQLGEMLHAFELGLLDEAEADAVATHILQCTYCSRKLDESSGMAKLLRTAPGMRELAKELDEESPSEQPVTPRRKHTRMVRIAALVAAAVILLVFRPWNTFFGPADTVVASQQRLAVIPFEFLPGDDTDRLSLVVTNLLITDLSESRFLQVVSSAHLNDIERFAAINDRPVSDSMPWLQLVRRTGAQLMLTGSVVQTEPVLVLTVQLARASDGSIVASQRITGTEDEDVFAVVDRLSARVREEILAPSDYQNEYDPTIADVTTHSAEAYRWYLEGLDYYAKHYFDEAEQCYRKAADFDSTFAMAHYCLSFHKVPGALDRAVRYSGNASRKERLYIQSRQAQVSGDNRGAIAKFEELVRHYPDEKIAWMELAFFAQVEGRLDDAVGYLQQSLDADPLYGDAMNSLAYVYRDMGQIDSALATADRYIELTPDEANPYDTRGELLAGVGRIDESIADYKRATEIKPDFGGWASLSRLGELYTLRGDFEAARQAFDRVILKAGSPRRALARADLAVVSMHQGQLRRALGELEDGIAADRLEKIESVSPGAAAIKYFVRSRILAAVGRQEETVAEIEKALAIVDSAGGPRLDIYLIHYASVLAEVGEMVQSDSVMKVLRGRHQDTDNEALEKAAGMVAFATGDYSGAVKHLESLTGAAAKEFDTRYLLGRARLELGRFDESVSAFESLLEDYTLFGRFYEGIRSVDIYYYAGISYESLGNREKALASYQTLLDLWTEADESLELISDARDRLKRLQHDS